MYDGPIIDCDVHHGPVTRHEYLEYLPKAWRDYVTMPGDGRLVPLDPPRQQIDNPDGANLRLDSFPQGGGPPGSSYELMREQLLDPYPIEAVVLGHNPGSEAAHPNPDLATALAKAMNDWNADRWLSQTNDKRLFGALLVPTHMPEEGAAEIRRTGQNPRFATAYISFNGLGKPFGHPAYHPLYEAMAEMGLPIEMHVSGGEALGSSAAFVSGGGLHHFKFEAYSLFHQPVMSHITSMIVHGVFEKNPGLKLLMNEGGLSWLPWLGATLDANYQLIKRESRWVKKWPSEYLHERLFLGTQPIEAIPLPADRQRFIAELSAFEGIEDMLVFTSDYPHWDFDDPRFISSIFPDRWHSKLFVDNARSVLRLPSDTRPATGPSVRSRSEVTAA